LDVSEPPKVTRSEISAGGLVVRRGHDRVEVLIARQHDRNRGELTGRLPKGHLDPGETNEEAALREVREEVGVEARIVAPLGEVAYVFHEEREGIRIAKTVHFYLMAWERGEARPADGEMQSVAWVPIAEAAAGLTFESERDVVARAQGLLESAHPPRL
jgi:ADP-ribose pyrophosphatase YjhB (NUDIX family)